jgi:threonine/homoserine/homoserine lactone efflux protein
VIAPAVLLAFVPVAALLTITPGTDTMLVLRSAGLDGARAAWLAALGIALGCLAWALVVAVGLGALIVASPVAYRWLRLCAALYLAWIGIGLIARPRSGIAPGNGQGPAFRRGLITNLINPKVGVFYLTLLPQFLPPGAGSGDAVVLAAVHIALSLGWFALLIGFARRLAPVMASPTVTRRIDRLCGAVFVGLGAKLALG